MNPRPDSEIEQCPKCGSTDRRAGQLKNGDAVAVQFVTDDVIATSDSGPVHAILCPSCRYLELFVPR